jgi:hypothetical protein
MMYHVTRLADLYAIKQTGLKPSIGPRSRDFGENIPAIYLFGSIADAEQAVMNWLGDQFDETEHLVLLRVDVTGVQIEHNAFEFSTRQFIPRDNISFIRVL